MEFLIGPFALFVQSCQVLISLNIIETYTCFSHLILFCHTHVYNVACQILYPLMCLFIYIMYFSRFQTCGTCCLATFLCKTNLPPFWKVLLVEPYDLGDESELKDHIMYLGYKFTPSEF